MLVAFRLSELKNRKMYGFKQELDTIETPMNASKMAQNVLVHLKQKNFICLIRLEIRDQILWLVLMTRDIV